MPANFMTREEAAQMLAALGLERGTTVAVHTSEGVSGTVVHGVVAGVVLGPVGPISLALEVIPERRFWRPSNVPNSDHMVPATEPSGPAYVRRIPWHAVTSWRSRPDSPDTDERNEA